MRIKKYCAVSPWKDAGRGLCLSVLLLCIVLTTLSCATPKEKTRLNVYNKPGDVSSNEVMGTSIGSDSGAASRLAAGGSKMTMIPSISDTSSHKGAPNLTNRFSPTEEVTVSVDTLPLSDFVNYVFKDLLNVNYILDSKVPVNEKLSLNLQDRVTKQKLFNIVSDILAGYNTIIREKSGVYYIVSGTPQQGIDVGVGTEYNDVPDSTGQIRQFVPLRYVPANTLMPMLVNLGTMTYPLQNENIVVVQGQRENVLQTLQLINAMDRPAMRGKFGSLFKVSYWDTKEMLIKLKEILSQEGVPVSLNAGEAGIRLISLERWRIILAFSAQKEWLDRLNYWINTLDIPEERDDKKFFIYFPENSRAQDLSETLLSILGMARAKEKSATRNKRTESARQQGTQFGQSGIRQPAAAETTSNAPPPTVEVSTDGGISSNMAAIADHVSVTVDDNRNALVIYTTPMYYKPIEALLKQIDLMPPQVLLEATVAEVTLTGQLNYGLEWYIRRYGHDLIGDLNILQNTVGSGGFDYALVNSANSFQLLINALADDQKIKVLSSPRMTVRDGKTASMVVGTEIPVISGDVASSTVLNNSSTGIVRSYQYRTTGITLQVTPTVHARGVLSLIISQGVSEPSQNNTSKIDSPIILNRNITTEVVAADGQTVMLGGLIKENDSQGITKVPWIGDIPILGYLFKTTSHGSSRTELIIMITPRIIRSPQQIEDMRFAIMRNFEDLTVENAN